MQTGITTYKWHSIEQNRFYNYLSPIIYLDSIIKIYHLRKKRSCYKHKHSEILFVLFLG